ncbi:MAG: hypothetical protein JWN36_877 [Microbacteriaceae bacterium]|nr:hypothetical protein [Microbacteriaceae bacterium]
MTQDVATRQYLIRLSPRAVLIRNIIMSVMFVSITVFGVLFFLGLRNGSWPIAIIGLAASLVVCALGYALHRSTFIGITHTTIEERGFFGRRNSVPKKDVAKIVFAHTYTNASPESVPQLVVTDAKGHRLLRMRGVFWTLESMRSVIASIDVPATSHRESMSMREFFTRYPSAAYWFENRPALLTVATIGILCAVGAVVLLLVHIVGAPPLR